MTRFVSCDQSTSSCALTLWEGEVPIDKEIIKTGSSHSKTHKKDVVYFPIITQQIDYICDCIVSYIKENDAELFVSESPSMGSFGDAKATLLTLFRAINETIIEKKVLSEGKVISYAPTAVKSFARTFLPLEEQKEIKSKAIKDKKTKEIIGYQDVEVLCEMNKKRMIQACNLEAPSDWLDGLTLASGKADYADSFWIGKTYLSGKQPTKKKEKK